jgi:hypothetical protein
MDRSAFLVAVAERLGFESTPGTVNRIIRELLTTRVYRLAEELAMGTWAGARSMSGPTISTSRARPRLWRDIKLAAARRSRPTLRQRHDMLAPQIERRFSRSYEALRLVGRDWNDRRAPQKISL